MHIIVWHLCYTKINIASVQSLSQYTLWKHGSFSVRSCLNTICGMLPLNESYLDFLPITGVVAEGTQCSLVWHGVNWGLAWKWSNLGWRQRLKADNEPPPVRNLIEQRATGWTFDTAVSSSITYLYHSDCFPRKQEEVESHLTLQGQIKRNESRTK